MKKYISYLFILAVSGMLLTSCQKDNFNYPDGYVGRSKITTYAIFTLTGGAYSSVVKGGTFTDPGATAKQGSETLKVTATGTVNTSTVGLYTITYSAANSDGFDATAIRYVAVLPAAEATGVNIAGKYGYTAGAPTASGTPSTITKLAPGFYYTSNVYSGAAGGSVIPAYIITSDGLSWIIPSQASAYGNMFGTAVLSGTAVGSTLNYTISIPSAGVNGSVRKWVKQ